MQEGKLRLKTLKLLQERPRTLTLSTISNDTGLTMPWLNFFLSKGKECDAGSNKIVKLYEYLSGKTLKI